MPGTKSAVIIRSTILATAVLVLGLHAPTVRSFEGDTSPETQLAELCGDYEFDLTDSGLGVVVIRFSAKDGSLWFQTESSAEPRRLETKVGSGNAFTTRDPVEGLYEIEFLPGQSGGFALARFKNDTLGVDVTGNRLERRAHFPTLAERLRSPGGLTEIRNDLDATRVAIYFGRGMDGHSAFALGRALQWMGCEVEVVDGDGIRRGLLGEFDVVAIPGGETDPDPWNDLGSDGKAKVQQFVRSGGGYVGICLGALFAASSGDFWGAEVGEPDLYLDLFPGVARCGQNRVAPKGSWPLMTDLAVPDRSHPIASALPERMKAVTYPNGPYFQPHEGSEVSVVATFAATGNPAMVAFEYGGGRVFLSGPHPEIEVDSERDGSSRFDELSDEGSEWPLLLAAMKWLTARNTPGCESKTAH
jgi:glutamine amidotransferase-like uncharacterized protein